MTQVFVDNKKIYDRSDKVLHNSGYSIVEVDEVDTMAAITVPNEMDVTFKFITHVSIKYNRDLVVKLDFHILIRNVPRRLCLLSTIHCTNEPPSWDRKAIIKAAETVQIANYRSYWHNWQRHSNRQHTVTKMEGIW